MKLSMWMIANRLSSLEMKLDIRENALANLYSARRAYATNCVHVYREKDRIVCDGEGDKIYLYHMDITQAFEIIQCVFDFYEDWVERIMEAARRKDYQEVIDQAWQVFHNPLILMDGNNKVLGISQQYEEEEMDKEWRYLCKYGYSSLNSIQSMKYDYRNIDFSRHGCQSYRFSDSPQMEYQGMSYCMSCSEAVCGRLNLLEKERKLNMGDHQLLEKLAMILEPSLGQHYYADILDNSNVFYNILFQKPYDKDRLARQLCYQQWKEEDAFYLIVVRFTAKEEKKELAVTGNLLLHTIIQNLPNCAVFRKKREILILSNQDLYGNSAFRRFFDTLCANNPIQAGCSLSGLGIGEAGFLYRQAKAALQYGVLKEPEKSLFAFYDYAMDFMVGDASLEEKVHACQPFVRRLWKLKKENRDEMLDTLKSYLNNERSVTKTAADLYTHRNTVLYRIKKIQELSADKLDDPYNREYILHSIRVLELWELLENNKGDGETG